MKLTHDLSFAEFLQICPQRIDNFFTSYLRDIPSLELKLAMEHLLRNGGKRLRPLLVYAVGSIFSASWENLDIPASAVELIHTYSLIHDDLPCMDNADLRRGKPSCHKVYGEDIAVLAGDGLQTLAFQIIALHPSSLKSEERLQMVNSLSIASGVYGMVSGQALDINMIKDQTPVSSQLLLDMYQLKTGSLISACIDLGRIASKDDDEVNQRALTEFGNCIGLAFQIQDDILDIEAPTEKLGKPQNLDDQNNKMTYPRLYGLNQAKDKVQSLYQEALEAINYLGHRAQLLRDLTNFILQRKS